MILMMQIRQDTDGSLVVHAVHGGHGKEAVVLERSGRKVVRLLAHEAAAGHADAGVLHLAHRHNRHNLEPFAEEEEEEWRKNEEEEWR